MNITDRYRRQVETSNSERQPYQSARVQDKRKPHQTGYDQAKKDLDPEKLDLVKTIAAELKVQEHIVYAQLLKFDWLESVARESIQTSQQWSEELRAHQRTEQAQLKKEREQLKKERENARPKVIQEESEEEVLYVPKAGKTTTQSKPVTAPSGTEEKQPEVIEPYYTGAFDETKTKSSKPAKEDKYTKKGPNNKRGNRSEYVAKQSLRPDDDAIYVPKSTVTNNSENKDAKTNQGTKQNTEPASKTTQPSLTESQSKQSESNHQSSSYSAFPQKQTASSKPKYYEDDDEAGDEEVYKKILGAPKTETQAAIKKPAEPELQKQVSQSKHQAEKTSTAPPGIENAQRTQSNHGASSQGSHAYTQNAAHGAHTTVAGQAIGGPTTTTATTSQRTADHSQAHHTQEPKQTQQPTQAAQQNFHQISAQASTNHSVAPGPVQPQQVAAHSNIIPHQAPGHVQSATVAPVTPVQAVQNLPPNITQSLPMAGGMPMMLGNNQLGTQTLYTLQPVSFYGTDGQLYQQQVLVPVQLPYVQQYSPQLMGQPGVLGGAPQPQMFYNAGMQMARNSNDPSGLGQQMYMGQANSYTSSGFVNMQPQPHSKP